MKRDDPFERTNAASGCASNDGEAILAAVREQHRTGDVPLPLDYPRSAEARWDVRRDIVKATSRDDH